MSNERYGRQKVSDLIASISRPLFQSHGLLDERLVFHWKEIVGEKLSSYSFPLKLVGGGQASSNTPRILEVLVSPGAALEMTYAKNAIIAKVNQFFGYAIVTDLRVKHGNIEQDRKKRPKMVKRSLKDEENTHIETIVTSIENENLRNALKNLGKALLSRK